MISRLHIWKSVSTAAPHLVSLVYLCEKKITNCKTLLVNTFGLRAILLPPDPLGRSEGRRGGLEYAPLYPSWPQKAKRPRPRERPFKEAL